MKNRKEGERKEEGRRELREGERKEEGRRKKGGGKEKEGGGKEKEGGGKEEEKRELSEEESEMRGRMLQSNYLSSFLCWLGADHGSGLKHLSECLSHERFTRNLHCHHVTRPLENCPN